MSLKREREISSGSVIRYQTLEYLREQVANIQAESKCLLQAEILGTRM